MAAEVVDGHDAPREAVVERVIITPTRWWWGHTSTLIMAWLFDDMYPDRGARALTRYNKKGDFNTEKQEFVDFTERNQLQRFARSCHRTLARSANIILSVQSTKFLLFCVKKRLP